MSPLGWLKYLGKGRADFRVWILLAFLALILVKFAQYFLTR